MSLQINPPPQTPEFDWVWMKWLSNVFDYLTKTEYRNFIATASAITADKETIILVDTTGGAITITLPPASDNEGRCYYIKDTAAGVNAVTVDGNASETIDGSTTLVLATARGVAKLLCDGAEWHVIGN